MATTPSIKVIKRMNYKGGTRDWSNRYHFNGGTPANDTAWHTLMDNVVAAEKLIFNAEVSIIECVGYAAGSDVPVSSKTYSQAGTGIASGHQGAGPVAALCRWSTSARSTKNHPIYLFNYWHGAIVNKAGTAGGVDLLSSDQRTTMETYAAAWISGFSDGSHTLVRAGPNGATATGHFVEEYVTHRDFPYSPSA